MKPVRLPAAATLALPRWGLVALCMLYILSGLLARAPWKGTDAASFGVIWTMAHGGLNDWLWPHIAGLPVPEEGPLAFWLGALCVRAFSWLLGDTMAARVPAILFFLLGSMSVWRTTYLLGRRPQTQPLRLAFGGQPEARDYGRTLADGALLLYVGALGLLLPIHATTPKSLQLSLLAFCLYTAVALFDTNKRKYALMLGMGLGAMVLARGFLLPLGLFSALAVLATLRKRDNLKHLIGLSLPLAFAICATWWSLLNAVHPFTSSPFSAWLEWNTNQIDLPNFDTAKYLVKNGLWFWWPAWPFAAWSVYAWRKQFRTLHISLPLAVLGVTLVLALLNHNSEDGLLIPMLPPLAVLAAFGLPTMKRGAINAVDWFSVMVLTTLAAALWIFWLGAQTGWPAQAGNNVLKLVPGFVPEVHPIAFTFALMTTVGWIWLVHWRIARRPSVLWRAVVLSSGGGILCWLLLMTLFLPEFNYAKSYAGVATQLAEALPKVKHCVESNAGPDQRASFAYFGHIPFSGFDGASCDYLLLQEEQRIPTQQTPVLHNGHHWRMIWEGRRPSDRDERFRLYRRQD